MAKIKDIKATEILDSRGNPTIEATVILQDGTTGVAAVPSGASVGGYEAMELRDGDLNHFRGLGVLKAIENIEKTIAPALNGMEVTHQSEIDRKMIELDGTQNKGRLGANAMLAVSMACCKAAAKNSVLPLFLYLRQFVKKENAVLKIPTPLFNVINGGKHAGMNLDFQEFMIIPATFKPYSEALEIGVTTYKILADILKQKHLTTLVGDEGGYAPSFLNNTDACSLLKEAIATTNLKFGFDIFIGMDIAADSFYADGHYTLKDRPMPYAPSELLEYYKELNKQYQMLYMEDPFFEDAWDDFAKLTQTMSQNTLVVGDDLTATNPYRLQMALAKKAITGMIIKPNQIGTVIETLAVVEIAREAGIKIIVSHRSGETNDDFIADFAVAVSADYVKFGAPSRGERIAKYNRLLQIEKQLKEL